MLPCAIVTGSYIKSRVDGVHVNADINQKHVDVREGSYLRFEARGGKALTIAMKGDTLFRDTWDGAGFTAGKPRKWYDVKVPREAMVAIEYELASRGLLAPAKLQA